jgi:primosomal protein N' (replication factor Y)
VASAVVFLDFDQELAAPRYRAWEEALGLLAMAGRLVGGRGGDGSHRARGRVIVQTRIPDHVVLRSADAGDPGLLAVAEATRRATLGLPPDRALALIAGPAAAATARRLGAGRAGPEVAELGPDRFMIRAADSRRLADELAAVGLPAEGVRVEVDPVRL